MPRLYRGCSRLQKKGPASFDAGRFVFTPFLVTGAFQCQDSQLSAVGFDGEYSLAVDGEVSVEPASCEGSGIEACDSESTCVSAIFRGRDGGCGDWCRALCVVVGRAGEFVGGERDWPNSSPGVEVCVV